MKDKNLVLIFMLVIIVSIMPLPIRASEAREESIAITEHSEAGESHEVAEAEGEHAIAEEHAAAGEHGEEAAHEGEHAAEHEEPWWRFPGWEIAFAALASIFFLLLMRWLPVILEDKSGGSA